MIRLKTVYEKIKDNETQRFCADIISVLGMTFDDNPYEKKGEQNTYSEEYRVTCVRA